MDNGCKYLLFTILSVITSCLSVTVLLFCRQVSVEQNVVNSKISFSPHSLFMVFTIFIFDHKSLVVSGSSPGETVASGS
jgi:hypothetical protein